MSRKALKPKRLVLNLLVASAQPITVKEMIAAADLFGIKESSVRVTLARLSVKGMVQARGRGQYKIGPQATDLAADISKWRIVEQRLKPLTAAG